MQATGKVINFSRVQRANPNTSRRKKPKILFVDDEERILNTLQALFRRQYDITTTTDGYHALELLQQDHYHLLVSDQRMPIMAGVDLLREAKNVSPDTLRILLTGYSDLAAIIGSVNDGEVFRFLNKPWDTKEFLATVDEAVSIGLELQEAAKDAKPLTSVAAVPASGFNPASDDTDADQADETHTAEPAKDTISQPAASLEVIAALDTAPKNIIVLRGDTELLTLIRGMLPGCQILAADDYDETIELMLNHEIGVIVSNLNDDNEDTLAFFSLLKNEHPQIVSILLANSGDSTTLIQLINHARVFRYMFKPIRERLMKRYLDSALEQYQKFRVAPTLLKQQKAQEVPLLIEQTDIPVSTSTEQLSDDDNKKDHSDKNTSVPVATQSSSGILGKMRKIRSFFSGLVSN